MSFRASVESIRWIRNVNIREKEKKKQESKRCKLMDGVRTVRTPPDVLICEVKSTNDRQENPSGDTLSAQEIFKIKA